MSTANLSPILASLYVALGGALGAVLRYLLGRGIAQLAGPSSGFPWATLIINVAGSLAMGVLLGWLARATLGQPSKEALQLLLGVGLLGGFTTFSTFSAELITLIHRGHLWQGFAYGSVSVAAGMIAFLIGLIAIQGFQ